MISPCYTWSHTPPACGSATGMQKPYWVAWERTPSPWGYMGACRRQNPGGSAPASTHAAAEAWTPVPWEPTPLSGGCTTTAGHDVMNRKHGSSCVVSDTTPAEEREKMVFPWQSKCEIMLFFPMGGWGGIIKCHWTKTNICQNRWALNVFNDKSFSDAPIWENLFCFQLSNCARCQQLGVRSIE